MTRPPLPRLAKTTAAPALGLMLLAAGWWTPAGAAAADVVEFLSGAKVEGEVTEIRNADREFDFAVKVGERTLTRTYAFSKIHAVTMKGKRFVITPKPEAPAGGEPAAGGASPTPSAAGGQAAQRSPRQIQQLIAEAAREPDWYASTPLDYPQSLDLDWPLQPPDKGWNNQKNMGQYLWDIIYPNPGRWRAGIKLVHHCLSLHKDDPALLQRDMKTLGSMYFRLLQDYPRAAFWLQKANAQPNEEAGMLLAECYWRMGSRPMALEVLNTRSLPLAAVKLLGDMGETQRAVQLADQAARYPNIAAEANLLGGDALRHAGQDTQAVAYYQKVLDSPARNEDYEQRYHARARESIEAIRLRQQAQVEKVADGLYKSFSTGYNGRMDVSVEVAGGKITDVQVTQHQEKQFYSALTDTPQQILAKQSVQGIDATSRATITSQAIVNAAAKALASGAR